MTTVIRNRVTGFRRVKASEILPHPKNWRTHNDKQRKALRSVLESIGFAGAILTYTDNEGNLRAIDGHLHRS